MVTPIDEFRDHEARDSKPGAKAPPRPSPKPPRDDGVDLAGPIDKTALRRRLASIYNIPFSFGWSEVEFKESEFAGMADSLADTVAAFPVARVALHLIGPVAGIADGIGKAKQIVDDVLSRRQTKKPPASASKSGEQPGGKPAGPVYNPPPVP